MESLQLYYQHDFNELDLDKLLEGFLRLESLQVVSFD
jgi:hypothetical protein